MTEESGYQTLLRVRLDDQKLMAAITDPADPTFHYLTELDQEYLDTFRLDSNDDGIPDLDFTFCSRSGKPGFQVWMRNRRIVGERQLVPRTVRGRRP
jgi:hypothetical protein